MTQTMRAVVYQRTGLFTLEEQVETLGFVPNTEHRFLIVAKNRK